MPHKKNTKRVISPGMHYATLTALVISNLTVFGLGAILSNQFLGNGLGYFVQYGEAARLNKARGATLQAQKNRLLSSSPTPIAPSQYQNAFNLGWYDGRQFVVNWTQKNPQGATTPLKVSIPQITLQQAQVASADLTMTAKKISDMPDGKRINSAYQLGYMKGMMLFSDQTAETALSQQDLVVINGGLTDQSLALAGYIAPSDTSSLDVVGSEPGTSEAPIEPAGACTSSEECLSNEMCVGGQCFTCADPACTFQNGCSAGGICCHCTCVTPKDDSNLCPGPGGGGGGADSGGGGSCDGITWDWRHPVTINYCRYGTRVHVDIRKAPSDGCCSVMIDLSGVVN
jgi:hypothetical protein